VQFLAINLSLRTFWLSQKAAIDLIKPAGCPEQIRLGGLLVGCTFCICCWHVTVCYLCWVIFYLALCAVRLSSWCIFDIVFRAALHTDITYTQRIWTVYCSQAVKNCVFHCMQELTKPGSMSVCRTPILLAKRLNLITYKCWLFHPQHRCKIWYPGAVLVSLPCGPEVSEEGGCGHQKNFISNMFKYVMQLLT